MATKCYKIEESVLVTSTDMVENNLLDAIAGRYELIDFLSRPVKSVTRVILECPEHGRGDQFGTPWVPVVNSVIHGAGCPKCAGKYRYTLEEYIEAVESRGYKFLSLVGEFNGIQSKVNLSCPVHGAGSDFDTPWIPSLNNLIAHGKGCPKCSKVYKRTLSEWIDVVNATKYTYLDLADEFVGKRSRIIVSCPVHGACKDFETPWIPRFEDLLRGNGCPKCAGLYNSSPTEYKRLVELTTPYKLINFIEPIKGKHTCVNLECPVHGEGKSFGTPWLPSLNNLLKGGKCPKCQKRYVYTLEDIEKKISQMSYELVEFISGEFKGVKSRVVLKCNKPHEEGGPFTWETSPDAVFSGRQCPACSTSSGGFNKLKPAYLYLHKITHNNKIVALKVGITNREPLIRMAQQSSWTEFEHILIATVHCHSGSLIYEAERNLLTPLKVKNLTGILTKEAMKDGFTETVAVSEMGEIISQLQYLGAKPQFTYEQFS
jgi:Zn ribbon nucleic-acid-binding protein